MSDRREFFARTVEEAVAKASATLGITQAQLEYEILDRGSTGFLGIGARDARILTDHPVSDATGAVAVEDELSSKLSQKEETSLPEGSAEAAETSPAKEGEEVAQTSEDLIYEAAETPYDLILAADEYMTSLVDAMGFDARVDVYDAEDAIIVDVAIKETGLFIGQKGETIDAIQYLANVAVYKDRPFFKRLVVDSEGYRQRRVEAIQGMAHRSARKALREKRPVSLPPMSPAERRVVHLFLHDNPDVTTSSDGEEEDRKVIVNPT